MIGRKNKKGQQEASQRRAAPQQVERRAAPPQTERAPVTERHHQPTPEPEPAQEHQFVAEPAFAAPQNFANIGKSISVKGELTGNEDLTVDGTVEGRIVLQDHNLTIGPNAHVTAEVSAKSVTVIGHVVGNIVAAKRIEIAEGGTVDGDVTAPSVVLAEGARFRGVVDMLSGKPAPAPQSAFKEPFKEPEQSTWQEPKPEPQQETAWQEPAAPNPFTEETPAEAEAPSSLFEEETAAAKEESSKKNKNKDKDKKSNKDKNKGSKDSSGSTDSKLAGMFDSFDPSNS